MKVAIAIDSFKGSLSSIAAGNAAAEGIRRVFPDAECRVRPLADGGEGTVDALVAGLGGELRTVTVTGPAGKPTRAKYGLLPEDVAVMEMAEAAGITLVSGAEKNPLHTTTYGVGEMILDAVRNGARKFVIGIGGSATNDGGAGMLQALGFRLLDADGNDIPRGGIGLAKLVKVERKCGGGQWNLSTCTADQPEKESNHHCPPPPLLSTFSSLSFRIACDVKNPLCGPNGASAVFGPQKGATPEMVRELDSALAHFAEIVEEVKVKGEGEQRNLSTCAFGLQKDSNHHCSPSPFAFTCSRSEGAGAAGGLGFAFKAFLGAELVPGVDLILNETHLEDFIRDADIVITGEGRLDGQTVMGKAPIGVARLAKRYGKRVLAFSGILGDGVEAVNAAGIDAYFPILRRIVPLEEALDVSNASSNLTATVEQVFRLLSF